METGTAFPASLLIMDAHSHYSIMIGLPKTDTPAIMEAIQHFFTCTVSDGWTTKIQYFCTNAGSYFTSANFLKWCHTHKIHVSIMAPHHQQMNSIVKCQWQTIHQISHICMVHACLPIAYYHFATLCAVAIINVRLAKGVSAPDGT